MVEGCHVGFARGYPEPGETAGSEEAARFDR